MRLTRRELLAAAAVAGAVRGRENAMAEPWRAGPYMLLDDALVAQTDGLVRRVEPPARLPEPVVTGFEDGCFQPYLSVIRSPETGRYRVWYGVPYSDGNTGRSSLATMDSADGIHFVRPHRVLPEPAPNQFGVSIIDHGPEHPAPERRFIYGWYHDSGLRIAASPDGLSWSNLNDDVVLRHNHDITSLHWDPIRQRYLCFCSMVLGDGPWAGRRIPHQSVSDDLLRWEEPWRIIEPSDAAIEHGETQFYCCSGLLARGELLVAFVKVLRDDLNAEPNRTAAELYDADRPFAGIGYTVVAWSRDGRTWRRETEPFLDRNPTPGTWNRAMAWGDDQLLVDGHTSIYYGGYRWGHKAERFTGRQIGYATMRRDRYVGYVAGDDRGVLRTETRALGEAVQVTINAAVDPSGELLARLVDERGEPIAGFDWRDCRPMRGDLVDHAVAWRGRNTELRGRVVALELSVQRGTLFGFDLG